MTTERRHINIGTLGHVDHGKTTLTAAISHTLSIYPGNKKFRYDQIDKAPEEKARGITINQTTIRYFTPRTEFAHVDCPGHSDYIKNMITGAAQMDLAILVVSALDGIMPQTKEHVLLAKQVGVQRIVVFINKCDMISPEEEELLEMNIEEIKDLLKNHGFIRDADGFRESDLILVRGSALKALEGDEAYSKVIIDLFNTIDEKIPDPQRDLDKPFLMPIDKCFTIKGRGTVVTGCIERGRVKLNDNVCIVGAGEEILSSVVTGVEAFNESKQEALAGENVGILLRGISTDQVHRGQVLCIGTGADGKTPTAKTYKTAKAMMYVLKEKEGGRHTPFMPKYRPQFYIRTADVTGTIMWENDNPVMPGDRAEVYILFESPVVLEVGLNFAVREGGRTIGSGVFMDLDPKLPEKIAEYLNSQK